jgi:hypothetical protein
MTTEQRLHEQEARVAELEMKLQTLAEAMMKMSEGMILCAKGGVELTIRVDLLSKSLAIAMHNNKPF